MTAADRELDRLAKQAAQAGQSVQKSGQQVQQMGGLSRQAQFGIQQLTYAVDDAVSVWGTSGFAGALRAAGNNITVMASAIGGLKAQILAVGAVALTSLVTKFVATGEAIDEATKRMDRLKESLESFKNEQDRLGEERGIRRQIRGLPREVHAMDQEGLFPRMSEIQRRIAQLDSDEMQFLRDEQELLRKQREAVEGGLTRNASGELVGSSDWEESQKRLAAVNETLEDTRGKLREVRRERRLLRNEDELIGERRLDDEAERQRAQFEADEQAIREARRIQPAEFGPGDFESASLRALLEAEKMFQEEMGKLSTQSRITSLPAANQLGSAGAASVISQSLNRGLPQANRQQQLTEEQLEELREIRAAIQEIRDRRDEERVANY